MFQFIYLSIFKQVKSWLPTVMEITKEKPRVHPSGWTWGFNGAACVRTDISPSHSRVSQRLSLSLTRPHWLNHLNNRLEQSLVN